MKRRELLISLLLAPLPVTIPVVASAAPDLAQEVRERLQQPEWLRGDFTQSKKVPGFAKPLVSSGNFIAARGRGVVWRTLKPFASELRLTQNEIRASQGGQTSMRLDASKEPAVRLITTLMFSLLNGDVSGLAELFELTGSSQGKGWQLVLVPRKGPLQQVLRKVELEGDGFVRRIQLFEANGDESLIQLANPRTDGAPEPGLFQ
ncbi:outer membrane lipoprotein carrier protein LolA [Paucibacter sp. JuS9]|uniref:outer membrane lipoprotein carrier protein LolA n=1 Tax=Paucibacter sp. JuS9 TaxID=3228748 RepID=UPI0037572878